MENPKFSGGLPGALGALRAERTSESLSEGSNLSATWGYAGFGPKFYLIEIATFIDFYPHQKLYSRLVGLGNWERIFDPNPHDI